VQFVPVVFCAALNPRVETSRAEKIDSTVVVAYCLAISCSSLSSVRMSAPAIAPPRASTPVRRIVIPIITSMKENPVSRVDTHAMAVYLADQLPDVP
jgi:hypothetical protein